MKKLTFAISILLLIIALLFVMDRLLHAQARKAIPKDVCINNLRYIDGAKQLWALENKKPTNSVPSEKEILPYMGRNIQKFSSCPLGGKYSLNAVWQAPTCTVTNHVLP